MQPRRHEVASFKIHSVLKGYSFSSKLTSTLNCSVCWLLYKLKRNKRVFTYDYFSSRAAASYTDLRDQASNLLSQIYSNNTVTEWLSDKIDDKITDAQLQTNRIESVLTIFGER